MQVKSSQVKARHAERAVSELVEESYKDFACSILVFDRYPGSPSSTLPGIRPSTGTPQRGAPAAPVTAGGPSRTLSLHCRLHVIFLGL